MRWYTIWVFFEDRLWAQSFTFEGDIDSAKAEAKRQAAQEGWTLLDIEVHDTEATQ